MNEQMTKLDTKSETNLETTSETSETLETKPKILDDQTIVGLFWDRSEQAIVAATAKYSRYCTAIARQILRNAEDADECVNDTWLAAWDAMPPHKPTKLSAFLGKITRRIAIDRLRKYTAKKRDRNLEVIFEELEPVLSSTSGPGGGRGSASGHGLGNGLGYGRASGFENELVNELERQELTASLNRFLATLAKAERQVFICRYWYMLSISEISARFSFSESNVKSKLHRTRAKLRKHLEKEGYVL